MTVAASQLPLTLTPATTEAESLVTLLDDTVCELATLAAEARGHDALIGEWTEAERKRVLRSVVALRRTVTEWDCMISTWRQRHG